MDEREQLNAAVERIGTATRKELLNRSGGFTHAEGFAIRLTLKHAGPVLTELIGENAKLKKLVAENEELRKLVAERSPGGFADAPVQYGGDE